MAAMVFTERHMCLNLMGTKDKAFLGKALILFDDANSIVVDRYKEAKCQLVVFKELIPCCTWGFLPVIPAQIQAPIGP